jgi:hypothetical protein
MMDLYHCIDYWKTVINPYLLMMIETYPQWISSDIHYNIRIDYDSLPLHFECRRQCRSAIIIRCIDLYPESLAIADTYGDLPLHRLLWNKASSIDDMLMMIEKFPLALQHRSVEGHMPLHIECSYQCRSPIILKCVQVYPLAVDDKAVTLVISHIRRNNFHHYQPALSILFTARPDCLYGKYDDIRHDPYYRRRILNLLPHHVFTPTHEADYRDLNWKPRYAMMMLLSRLQIKQQQEEEGIRLMEMNGRTDNAWCVLLLRMLKISSMVYANSIQGRVGICQDDDLGDAFLRFIIAFL